MTEQPVSRDIDLETLLASAGQSFTEAQRSLLPGLDVSINMMLSNAELELKVAVAADAAGRMTVRPISSEDISRGDIDPGMLSTLRISFVSSVGELTVPQTAATPVTESGGSARLPDLTGLSLDEAVAYLKASDWRYEAHAAGAGELQPDAGTQGKVLRQEPEAAQTADKSTTVHFWVDLGTTSVKEIDGIGDKVGENLSKIGIRSVGDLSLADITEVASALRMSEARVKNFVDMAALMARLTVLGLKDEVVEILVKGAGIRNLKQLAGSDPAVLYKICREAIRSGSVRVPAAFVFSPDDVAAWIAAAGK